MNGLLSTSAALVLFCVGGAAVAAVSADEAAKLKGELNPLGGIRAGNADGSIPAWSGGLTTPIPGDKAGGRRGDPFKDEKPLFTVTAKNVDQYADRLTDGTKALLKKYPDSYRVDIYQTHRTAAAPQWVYDNTLKNATRAKMDGDLVAGAFGGIAFPIPKAGAEIMWNHLLRWRSPTYQFQSVMYQNTSDGKLVLTTDAVGDAQLPYYFQEGSPEAFAKFGYYYQLRLLNSGPPIRAGEAIAGGNNIDSDKDVAYVYLTGQRRVRRLPNSCCDTPTPASAGLMSFDDIDGWTGSIHRFDWKILGKKEMYIPYNANRLHQPKVETEVLAGHHIKPEYMRWELHRVWVVEATVRAGQRHQAPRSRYYCDEDSWICVMGDRWDANGQLWKTIYTIPFVAPDLPGVLSGVFGYNDLLSGQGMVANMFNSRDAQYPFPSRYPERMFTPDGMVADSVR